jgi:hypothetical protein
MYRTNVRALVYRLSCFQRSRCCGTRSMSVSRRAWHRRGGHGPSAVNLAGVGTAMITTGAFPHCYPL